MDSAGGIIFLLLIVGAVVGIVMFRNGSRSPFQVDTVTGLSPEEAIRTAIQNYTMAGWSVTSQAATNATFVMQKRASCLVAGLLFLLGIIPGVLYLYFAGRTINVNVHARQSSGSKTSVQIQGTATGFGGKETADRVIQVLGAHA